MQNLDLIVSLPSEQVGLDVPNSSVKKVGEILNLRSYRFVHLDHLEDHRLILAEIGKLLAVQGTIILSTEGINLTLSGNTSSTEQMFEACKAIPGLENLRPKISWSSDCAFQQLKVKIKPEIIKMDCPEIQPGKEKAPRIDSLTLQKWLKDGFDENGIPIKVLDTRNSFEIAMGSFHQAVDLKLTKFSEFPKKVLSMKHILQVYRIINVCTGGIRCEKASLFMMKNGFKNVTQLDGGIIEYLNSTEGYSWEGECFLFDNRETI